MDKRNEFMPTVSTRGSYATLNDVAAAFPIADRNASKCSRFSGLALRSIGALGVVYGDIGTSPLYTLNSVYQNGDQPLPADLMGAASCLVWTVTLVVVCKYILMIMRADHEGEGGIFALLLLVPKPAPWLLSAVAVVGGAMLIGDGMITPAMSVLSAFEGLDSGPLAGKGFTFLIIPVTILVLLLLFAAQPFGIGKLGRVFGPIMVLYFVAIGCIGFYNIRLHSRWEIFEALSPMWAIRFFYTGRFQGWAAFWQLGTFVLSVTGAEALYADLGHFGRAPIVISWFMLVYPSLVLGYLGQAAYLMDKPENVTTAFWSSVPSAIYAPMLVLVPIATIIASQSLIAGCYSLINQAVVLGLFPQVKTVHTDRTNKGQIFIPEATWMLCIGTVAMVVFFQHSAKMAGAYGIAVTGTFMMTTMLFFSVYRRTWKRPLIIAVAVCLPMLCMDVAFFVANTPKVLSGGWVPLAIGLLLTLLMLTWHWGQKQVEIALGTRTPEATAMLKSQELRPQQRMDVVGIFLLAAPLPETVMKDSFAAAAHSQVLCSLANSTASLPRISILLAVDVQNEPFVCEQSRLNVQTLPGEGDFASYYVRLRVGFAQPLSDFSVHEVLGPLFSDIHARFSRAAGTPMPVRYFLGQYAYRSGERSGLWQRLLLTIFRAMKVCSKGTVAFLNLPQDMVVLVGDIMDI
jgi:KUP system potassium uptake protein